MFSNSSKYAIKAVLYLAMNSSKDEKVMAKDISEPINVPQAYIAKLLQQLSKHEIVSSLKGPKGGFYLSEKNRKQSIMRIVDIIDGEEKLSSCLLSLKKCNELKPCPLHDLASPSRTHVIESLNSKTIDELSSEIKLGHVFLPL